MHITQRQEQFSNAYLRAVASVAGYALSKPEVDDDSVDFMISGKTDSGINKRPRLELQLKCFRQLEMVSTNSIIYDLKVKNYNDLVLVDISVPRILVIVVVPDIITDWITQSDEELTIKYCGYWESLRGKEPSTNTSKVRITIPKANQFSVDELTNIMNRISNGGLP